MGYYEGVLKMKLIIKSYLVDGNVYTSNQKMNISLMRLGSEVYARVSGTSEQCDIVKDDPGIEIIDDLTFLSKVREYHPTFELYNCDVSDIEVDTIAISSGLSPLLRGDILVPRSSNVPVLQEQEKYLLSLISERKGKTKEYWDIEAEKVGKLGIEIDDEILNGTGDSHEFVLSRLRS